MKKSRQNLHTVDQLFPLVFILLFCCCALLVVLQGANIYEKTTEGLQENYTVRTAVAYLQEKTREVNDVAQVEILSVGGSAVLALHTSWKEEEYTSYIYVQDGYLRELLTKTGNFTGLSGGQKLMALDQFLAERPEKDLLRITVRKDGQEETIYVRLDVQGNGEGTQ